MHSMHPLELRLYNAVISNDVEEISYLAKRTEFERNICSIDAANSNELNFTALHKAAHLNNATITRLLIDLGASQAALDSYERTPLHIACHVGAKEAAQILINGGSDVNWLHRDLAGCRITPLHQAILVSKNLELVKLLLENGADPDIRTVGGTPPQLGDNHTAYQAAIASNSHDIAEIIMLEKAKRQLMPQFQMQTTAISFFNKNLKGKTNSFKENQTLRGHSNGVTCLVMLPNGQLASSSYDGSIKIWDIHTGQCLHTWQEHSSGIIRLILLPDGHLASGSGDNTIKIWDISTGRCLQTLGGHSDHVHSLTVLPDGRLASGSQDCTIKVWDIQTGKCCHTWQNSTQPVLGLATLPNNQLASCSYEHAIKIWDIRTGQGIKTFQGHSHNVYNITLLPDDRLVSGSFDHTIKIWDSHTGHCHQTLRGHSSHVHLCSITILPDGRLASGATDKTIKIWDIPTERCLQTLHGHSNYILSIAALPDGRLASGSHDTTIKIWKPSVMKLEFNSDEVSELQERFNECRMS